MPIIVKQFLITVGDGVAHLFTPITHIVHAIEHNNLFILQRNVIYFYIQLFSELTGLTVLKLLKMLVIDLLYITRGNIFSTFVLQQHIK